MSIQPREAIILAGGLGTRLRSAVPDLPKCMAPVKGRPFVAYVLDYLRQQHISRFIFAWGYKNEAFLDFLNTACIPDAYTLSVEPEPLGTGGAVQLACAEVKGNNVLVVNGDTFFRFDMDSMFTLHAQQSSACTLALKKMVHIDRYGVVETEKDTGLVTGFREKQYYETGNINGGVYLLDKDMFLQKKLPEKFSFEKDYLERFYAEKKFYGVVQNGFFIDIGIPEDYLRAQQELD